MQTSLADLASRLRSLCAREDALINVVYHINPDGDCVGSAFALVLILRSLGARAAAIGRDPVPEQFRELTDRVPQDSLDENALYFAVDCKDRSRTGDSLRDKDYAFWIDHHGSPHEQAELEYVRPESSSCGELILQLAEELGVPVTPQMAELLYVALVTDTMSFRTSSTNAGSFEAAAKLYSLGADVYRLGRLYTMVKSPQRLAIEQRVFGGMHTLREGRLVSGIITLEDLKSAGITDTNGPAMQNINGLLEVIGSARITIMIREYPRDNPEGHTRFSIKTTAPGLSAREIAEHFGGGGHPSAAGGFLPNEPQEARAILEAYCEQYLDQHSN